MKNEPSSHDNKLRLGVKVWLPYKIYWKILPELLRYHFDLFRDSFEKWAHEFFSNKNNEMPDEGKTEEMKDGEKNDKA